ncbi:MAG: hypothetical protein ABIJ74_01105 [archaeon]
MTARINWETKAKAFHLYCVGLTQQWIADEIRVNIRTIQHWIVNYDWAKSRKELEQITLENTVKTTTEIHAGIIRYIFALFAEKIRDPIKREKLIDDLKISDVLNTMKYELLLESMNTKNTLVSNPTDDIVRELEALDARERESFVKQENSLNKIERSKRRIINNLGLK